MKADLSDVPLRAADSANVALTVRAFQQTSEHCTFGDIVLFTDKTAQGPFEPSKSTS